MGSGAIILLAIAVLAVGASSGRSGRLSIAVPPKADGALRSVYEVASLLEPYLPGFGTFATAAAAGESGGNNLVGLGGLYYGTYVAQAGIRLNMNELGEREQKAATTTFQSLIEQGYFQGNPYLSPAASERAWWCFGSGGWYGLLPGSGMKAGGPNGPFRLKHPSLIFDPIASTAMLADFVVRLTRTGAWDNLPASERNWLAIRRGMRALTILGDYNEENATSAGVRERFEDKLIEIGADPDFMWQRVDVTEYPGADAVYASLQEAVA